MRFKKYMNEIKKTGKVFYMGNDVEVQYEVEKWTTKTWRIRLIKPKVTEFFGYLEKDKRQWNAEIKRSRDTVTVKYAGIWNRKNDAIEEILNELYKEKPVNEVKMGVIWGTGPDMRRYPKTGWSKDFIGKGDTKSSGFANSTDNYYDRLDPRNVKKRKKSWLCSSI